MRLRLGRLRRRPAWESRTEVWRQVGLGAEIDRARVPRPRGQLVVLTAAIAGVLIAFGHRRQLFPGLGSWVQIGTVAVLVILGWALARAAGRGIAPSLYRRLDPGTAGTVGFLIRLLTIALVVLVALRVAGVRASTLAVGGAFTAVVLGLAAQQTVGNLIAGIVLQSTRAFRVGERIRLVGGAVAGQVEGIVGSLGLFYTTLVSGADRTLVPNSMILNLAVAPVREPDRIELRARLAASTTPGEVEDRLRERVTTPMRYPPQITLEELDRDEIVVRVIATPEAPRQGATLAAEVLAAMRSAGSAAGGDAPAGPASEGPAHGRAGRD